MRDYGDRLSFAPRLPSRINRLVFRVVFRGRHLQVNVRPDSAVYEVVDGEPLDLLHHGESFTVGPGSPQTRPVPPAPRLPPPEQPPGRAPPRRHAEA
jgi:alpha,alpha-trehalose phosphorylase